MKIKVTKGKEILEESLSITIQEKDTYSKFLDLLQNPYVIVITILVIFSFLFVLLRLLM